ncbi:LysM peptidoglycan-binding domain-containing protein [Bacillus sp. AGMB 02131]|uniref:LysM peptidoglycan-binding domain-containing protein n=1 Tax=Peribacillus faecalis TaxID=2772559 RepID=A0A927HAD4_9BACI|nr:LysM peptidoglycan-binding domain-containing protein [Peribacillus faecalis]MBD3107814.1 LysM peptidoglycan-binding domain-containing protein [Peribacillus faecalis]
MSEQNQSFLRFSLEESIWFPKGFEVSELYSLSIEPDVNIIEKDQYVVIEGSLEISGEYRGFANQQASAPLEAEQNHRQLVHDVFLREEDSLNVFTHQFPVDISIPANRVEDRSAIEVEISTFDYSMPESNCIKLISELMISGIYDGADRDESSVQAKAPEQMIANPYSYSEAEATEEPGSPPESSFHEIPTYESYTFSEESRTAESQSKEHAFEPLSEESHTLESQSKEQAFESFTVEAYALPRQESADNLEEETEEEAELAQPSSSYSDIPSFSKPLQEPSFTIPMPVFKAPDMDFSGISEYARNNNNNESQAERAQSEYWSVDDESELNDESDSIDHEEPSIADFSRSEEESMQITFHRSEEVQEEQAKEESEPAEKERSGSMTVSLTDFFGKKDSHTHTRLKVCIVQAGDNLSEIASRYEVSRLDLLNLNELDSESDLQVGQVLYIPQKIVRK